MDKEKQIEEMARFICHCYEEGYCRMDGKLCDLECGSYKESEIFYDAGYRKQIEGEWIYHSDDLFPAESTQECSVCHAQESALLINENYCPNCGAKMKGGAE